MKVKYSDDVKDTIRNYSDSLKNYLISKERRNTKIRMLRRYLHETIKSVVGTIGTMSYPLCQYEDLGQVFDQSHNPLNKNLRQTNFSDESRTQWSISFMVLEDNTILICHLVQSSNVVKESIKITESQLRQIIKESIKEILKKA